MDPAPAVHATDQTTSVEVAGAMVRRQQPASMAPHVAETMRRVHARLRSGVAPSYEMLLALGGRSSRGSVRVASSGDASGSKRSEPLIRPVSR